MPLYVTLSRGVRAAAAQPMLASSDRSVVDAVLEAVSKLGERTARAEDARNQAAERVVVESSVTHGGEPR